MAGVDPSEHERLSQRFNEAKQLYEGVILRKGPWFENRNRPDYYSDQQRVSELETSLHILDELQETLRRKPEPNEWLLHLAGVHWQRALALFMLSRYDQAAAANAEMQALIPHVPPHMWNQGQDEVFWSNYHFLEGELAIASGNNARAIQSFEQSREIDARLGDHEALIKCDYYLKTLGALPPRRVDLKKFIIGKAAFLIIASGSLAILGQWTGVNVWRPSGVKGLGLLAVSILSGILADRIVQRLISLR